MPHKISEARIARRMVMNGTLTQTKGGLRKADLKHNRAGLIVSRAASAAAKRKHNLGASELPKGSHTFVAGGADAGAGAVRVVRRRSVRRAGPRRALPTCHRGKSVHCRRSCIVPGLKCHKKRYLKR